MSEEILQDQHSNFLIDFLSNKANSIINGVLYGLARVLVYSGIDIFSEKCVTDICPP